MRKFAALAFLLGLAFSANAAFADPVPVNPMDPTVIINKTDPPMFISFSKDTKTDPLTINLVDGILPMTTYKWEGGSPLTTFYVALSDSLPFEPFDCSSNIFKKCEFISTVGTPLSNDVEFEFFGGGSISPQESFTVAVATPEPGTIVLLATGVLLIGLGRRW